MKELNNYLLLIAQFVLSIAASFAAGYLAPYYFYGILDQGTRLLVGLVFAFVVAMADMYFIVRFMLQAEGVIDLREMDKKRN